MAISVIVVSHRLHRWLADCLASVADQCDEVVVVDNGSDGGEVATTARAAGARVVGLSTNVGFPAGVNAGVAAATGDVVALLNDDAMADPGWLASAAAALSGSDVGAVAPKLVFALPFAEVRFDDEPRRIGGDARPLGRAIRTATVGGVDVLERLVGPGVHAVEDGELDGRAGRWRWTAGRAPIYVPLGPDADPADIAVDGEPAPVVGQVHLVNNAGSYLSTQGWGGDYGYLSPDDGRFDQPAERFGACGGALVTTAATLARVGPFAGSFFAYYEDVDWCWRARLAGLRILYEPSGVVRHVGGVTSGGPLAVSVRDLAARNRLLCLARNAPLPVAAAQVRRALTGVVPPGLRRAVASHLPGALAGRPGLARGRRRRPAEVWKRWAGVDETW
ncbi:MAG: glycosyltransferase family 2 protein [Acidimicrobiales bacterium]